MLSVGPVFNTTHAGGNAQINNINGNVTYILSEEKEDKIYRWLDAPDSSGNFLAAREKHHAQTGAWFIEGKEYLRWKETPDSALWVYGTPGCGKTIICSTVIEEISEECAATPTFACAYFFFDSRNAQTDLSLHNRLVRSIIKQLSHQSAGFPAPLADLYGGGQQQPSIKSLHLILEQIIDGFERTYIIIDAVDECTDREKVLTCIEQLTKRKKGNLYILFSSRPERDIVDLLQSVVSVIRVTLNGRLADKDIETYLDAMLSKLTRWDPATIARVRDALITGSDGMFRWVALQISELFKCRTRKAVDDQLRNLPKDLEGMYEQSLLNSAHPQDLKQFLLWLAFSARPLESEELADVVTVNFPPSGLPSYDPDLRYFGTADMLITCSSFVTEIEAEKEPGYGEKPTFIRVIKLAHMSVKDYLVSDRLKHGPASYFWINAMLSHSLITKTCLAYLFYLGSFPSIKDSVLEILPLSQYAANHWIKHMQLGGGEDRHLSQMLHCIFSCVGKALANWVRFDNPEDSNIWFNPMMEFGDIASPLYYAGINGFTAVVQELLVRGADANNRGGFYGNVLQAGSLKGHDATVRLLLLQGADVNAQVGYYGSALQAASFNGHGAIVQLLIEKGADVNAQGGYYGNALQAASVRDYDGIVRLLLEKGANVNAQGGHYGSALQGTSFNGHVDIAQLLLEKGAAVNAQGGSYGSALQAASVLGYDGIVRLLLEKGADVNAQGGNYGSALQAASRNGHEGIVRLLLEKGADVNAKGGWFGSALQAARVYQPSNAPRHEGRELIVKLLLKNGAIDEDSDEDNSSSGEDADSEEHDDEVHSSGEIEGGDSSAGNGSEDEWASAQEDAEEECEKQ